MSNAEFRRIVTAAEFSLPEAGRMGPSRRVDDADSWLICRRHRRVSARVVWQQHDVDDTPVLRDVPAAARTSKQVAETRGPASECGQCRRRIGLIIAAHPAATSPVRSYARESRA